MSLRLAATATLGQLRYAEQIRSVRAHLTLLPGVNRVEVAVAATVRVDASPGTTAEVALEGGDGPATIITGTVARVERRPFATVVTVTDAGAALAALRPVTTWRGLPFVQVIREIADTAGVDTGLVAVPGQVADWVPGRRTAAEQVAILARLGGGLAHVDAGGRLVVATWPLGIPDVAMRLDREFLSCTVRNIAPAAVEVPVGAGGSGTALAPDAWLAATEALTTGGDPDATHRWQPEHVLRTLADVRIATDGAVKRRDAATRDLTATCWPQPARRPGDVVLLQHTTHDEQAGPWLLTHVLHAVGGRHATTTLLGLSAGATGPGGALGALAGAIGGLA